MDKKALLDCWTMFRREHGVSVDRMICDPELRSQFLTEAMNVCESKDEQQILWVLMGLRKSKKLIASQSIA